MTQPGNALKARLDLFNTADAPLKGAASEVGHS